MKQKAKDFIGENPKSYIIWGHMGKTEDLFSKLI